MEDHKAFQSNAFTPDSTRKQLAGRTDNRSQPISSSLLIIPISFIITINPFFLILKPINMLSMAHCCLPKISPLSHHQCHKPGQYAPAPGYICVAATAPATNITMAPIDTTLNTGNPAVPLEEATGSPVVDATKKKEEEAEQGRGETTKKMAIIGEVGDSSDGVNSEKIGEKRDGERSVGESNPSPVKCAVKELVQCARSGAADGGGDRTGSDISSSRKQKGSLKGAKFGAGPTPKAPQPPQPPRSRLGHQMMQSVQVFHKLGVKAQTSNKSNQSIPNEQMTEEKVILMDLELLDFETIHVTVANSNSSVV